MIGDCSFLNCSSLNAISFDTPSSLKSLGKKAFASCLSLKEINIPATVVDIDEGAFYVCRSLKKVSFSPSSLLTQN